VSFCRVCSSPRGFPSCKDQRKYSPGRPRAVPQSRLHLCCREVYRDSRHSRNMVPGLQAVHTVGAASRRTMTAAPTARGALQSDEARGKRRRGTARSRQEKSSNNSTYSKRLRQQGNKSRRRARKQCSEVRVSAQPWACSVGPAADIRASSSARAIGARRSRQVRGSRASRREASMATRVYPVFQRFNGAASPGSADRRAERALQQAVDRRGA